MRIHIFGASGSGVTTLGKALSQKLAIKYFDSDDFFWLKTPIPFTERQSPEIRNMIVSQKLHATDHWIFGGSMINWGENIFPDFDLIIFLYLPPEIRLERLKKREYERYGDKIIHHPEKAKKFQEFIDWAADYDHNTGIASRTLKAHLDWLSTINTPLLEISGDHDVQQKIDMILNILQQENIPTE